MTEGEIRRGVLVANLGTPERPERKAVARYLREFLSDPRVVDLPRWLWLPLLYLVIVPLRAGRSAAAYAKIWTEKGSPLLTWSQKLTDRLAGVLDEAVSVRLAMRYGKPSVRAVLEQMRADGVQQLAVLPLYPQFSYTTTASVFDAVDAALKDMDWQPDQKRVEHYYGHPAWSRAVADVIRDYRERHGTAERLLFSLHGIPQRYDREGDPYAAHCCTSVVDIAGLLGIQQPDWFLAFQSRVGKDPWLQPYTDVTLSQWAESGIRHVQVVCPGFAVDCIETLEEIALQNAEDFIAAGGEKLEYIPCLNDSDAHVQVLAEVVRQAWGEEAPEPAE